MLLPPNEAANLFSSLPSDLNDPLAKAPSVTSTLDLPPVPAAPRFEIVPPPDLKNWYRTCKTGQTIKRSLTYR
uniref:Uncharacterized protein n=1 Tax=Desertifilum tharense IPPAS B-1220 TaxID=1781255 RepID=A0ACD5GV80_9CYAN